MHLNITFEMGVTLAVLAGLALRLDQGQACRRACSWAQSCFWRAFGVIAPEDAFSGFANSGVLIVAALFVVAAGLARNGRDGLYRRTIPGPG